MEIIKDVLIGLIPLLAYYSWLEVMIIILKTFELSDVTARQNSVIFLHIVGGTVAKLFVSTLIY